MIKANVYNQAGEKVSELELNPAVFGLKVKAHLVSQAVIAQQANSRTVLADTKDRSEVRGGGKKPWKQKGTGRARVGSRRSPLWSGGGITFGPNNDRNFAMKINKKVKKQALLMSLSDKAANEKIILVDKMDLEKPKTKKFFEMLLNLKLRAKREKIKGAAKIKSADEKKIKKSKKVSSILLVLPKKEDKIERSAKNIPSLTVISANSLNIVDVLSKQYILMPVDSLTAIEKTFVK
jgi:large subunit ribosomal protein L4